MKLEWHEYNGRDADGGKLYFFYLVDEETALIWAELFPFSDADIYEVSLRNTNTGWNERKFTTLAAAKKWAEVKAHTGILLPATPLNEEQISAVNRGLSFAFDELLELYKAHALNEADIACLQLIGQALQALGCTEDGTRWLDFWAGTNANASLLPPASVPRA